MQTHHLDVLIVGAGLSGIGAAYHLQESFPDKTYAILEARDRLGGTWDFFRYPGIRSDSDMYTLGYSFRPWTESKALADGPAILKYVRETAEAFGIDRRIRYGKRVERASWSSQTARWTVSVRDAATGEVEEVTCGFLFTCAGYYDYDEGYTPDIPGRERYTGRVVHPQKWTPDIDYAGKRVVVIGSGATAVTLVPELAKRAAHVTMLQRSPTYILSVPEKDKLADWMRRRLPGRAAYATTRWKNVLLSMGFYQFCRRFPARAKGLLVSSVDKALGGKVDATHFTPSYMPWDQRLCFVPDGDLFDVIGDGRADIVTGHIETFTEKGLRLRTGQELDCDLVVTATGLKLKLIGGIALTVDGTPVEPAKTTTYKGLMLSGVPNLAIAIGYTNASWTLKCDLISQYVCRLLRHMDAHGYTMCCPRRKDTGGERPILDLASGYVTRAIDALPRQGTAAPWVAYQNYVLDLAVLRHAPLVDRAMEFSTPNA